MSLRKDVFELLCWLECPEPPLPAVCNLKRFGDALYIEEPERPQRDRPNLRSLVPDHLRTAAYLIARDDGLIEEQPITAEVQEGIFKFWKLTPHVHARHENGELSPIWQGDALVHLTPKGEAALCAHRTPSERMAARLIVDICGMTAMLDGIVYGIKSKQTLRWLKVLAEHPNEWISGSELKDYDKELDGVRTSKLRKHLPEQIDKLLEADPGRGSRIHFDAGLARA